MSANKAACASCSEAMRRNIIERRSQRGRAGKLASPPAASTGASQHRTMSRHNFADSGDKRKHNVLCGRLPGTSTRPFLSTLCREHAINLGGRGVEPFAPPSRYANCSIWMSGRLARELPHLGPTAPAELGRKCALGRPDGNSKKRKTPLGRRRGLVARCDDRTKLVYAVAYRDRRRRANARRPPQAARSPGSPAPTMGPGTGIEALQIEFAIRPPSQL